MLSTDKYRFMAFTPGCGGNFISSLFHQLVSNQSYLLARQDSNEYKYVTHSCANLGDYNVSKAGNNWLDKNRVAFYVGNLSNNLHVSIKNIEFFFNDSEFAEHHNRQFKHKWIISHMLQPGANLVLQETTKNIYEKNVLLLYKRAITGVTYHQNGYVEHAYTTDNLEQSDHFKQIVKNIKFVKENNDELLIHNQEMGLRKSFGNMYKVVRKIEWSDLLSPEYKKSEWDFIIQFFGISGFYETPQGHLCFYNAIQEYIDANERIINSDTGKVIRELLEKHT